MKYQPQYIEFESYEQLGKYLDLVNLTPSNTEKPYFCTLCNRRYRTETGAWNHIDNCHKDAILEIKNS